VSRRETRHDMTSATLDAKQLGPILRDHRAVENGLHWVMEMTFRDDACRIRTDSAPENFVTLKHMAAISAANLAANLAEGKRARIPSA